MILRTSVFYCNAMFIPVFNVTLVPVLNFLGRSLFNTSVGEINGKTWKHSRRFKSNAELTYSKEYV